MTTKKTTTQTQSGNTSGTFSGQHSNEYGWQQMPDSEDITALRGYREQIDPSIGASHARRQTNLRRSFQNPLGAHTTSAMRDAMLRSGEGELEQEYGQAQRQGYNDMQQRTGQRLQNLAGLTAPTLTQTGGTSSGTSAGTSSGSMRGTESDPLLPAILSGASQVGAAAF